MRQEDPCLLSDSFPLLREYERSASEGLILGSSITVPNGYVAAVVTRGGKLTDILPRGMHPVQPETLPGLAASTRIKPAVGIPLPVAVYLVDIRPVRDIPWSLGLDVSGGRPGHY